jgi:hypothetical protein
MEVTVHRREHLKLRGLHVPTRQPDQLDTIASYERIRVATGV